MVNQPIYSIDTPGTAQSVRRRSTSAACDCRARALLLPGHLMSGDNR